MRKLFLKKKIDWNIIFFSCLFLVIFFWIVYFSVYNLNYTQNLVEIQKIVDEKNYPEAQKQIISYLAYYGNKKELLELYLTTILKEQEQVPYFENWIMVIRLIRYMERNFRFLEEDFYYYGFLAYYGLGETYYGNLISIFDSDQGKKYIEDTENQKIMYHAFIKEGMFNEASLILNNLLKKEPNNLYFKFQNAMLLKSMGFSTKSIYVLQDIVFNDDLEYGSYTQKAGEMLIEISLERQLSAEVEYYYHYLIERSGPSIFWEDKYKEYKGSIDK